MWRADHLHHPSWFKPPPSPAWTSAGASSLSPCHCPYPLGPGICTEPERRGTSLLSANPPGLRPVPARAAAAHQARCSLALLPLCLPSLPHSPAHPPAILDSLPLPAVLSSRAFAPPMPSAWKTSQAATRLPRLTSFQALLKHQLTTQAVPATSCKTALTPHLLLGLPNAAALLFSKALHYCVASSLFVNNT